MGNTDAYRKNRVVEEINYSTTRMKYTSDGYKVAYVSKNTDNLVFTVQSSIPNGLKKCLKNVIVGKQMTQIPPSGFIDCGQLVTVTVPTNCIYIQESAFRNCSSLRNTNILSGGEYAARIIGNHAFDGCESLLSININLKASDYTSYHIGEYAFANYKNLEHVTWQNYSYLGDHMFAGCTSLKDISIPNNTNYIFPYCLADIPNLETIRIPNKIWMIPDGCFQNDVNLKNVDIVDDGKNKSVIDHVGNCLFDNCPKLTSITFPESMTDMSCFEPYALSGSNIQRVIMKGMDDEKFVTNYTDTVEVKNTGYIRTLSDFKKIQDKIISDGVPVVFFTNHYVETNTSQGGCSFCVRLANDLRKDEWKTYMNSHLSSAFFVYAEDDRYTDLYNAISHKRDIDERILKAMPEWGTRYYAKAMVLMIKEDGSVIAKKNAPYSSYEGYPVKFVDSVLSNFTGKIGKMELNTSITKLGSPLSSITFVSKQGHEFECTNETKVEYTPEVRVDKQTTSDFKYGTWYYNAKQLREFADQHNVPVFVEYSSKGCKPCEYFKTNVFNNSRFQDWVSSSKYLFCRVEVEGGESFNQPAKYPQPYYVNYVWAKEKYGEKGPMPPVLFWYWKKKGDVSASVFDVQSYHFNPSASGSVPPFSMDELMSITDNYFKGYVGDSELEAATKEKIYTDGNRHIGYRYANQAGDDNGRFYQCDSRTKITEYSGTFDIKGYTTISRIQVGMTVPFPSGTYQYFTGSDSNFPDHEGVIFQVSESRVVNYMYEFENKYDYEITQKYENATWYNLDQSSETGLFDDIIKDSEDMDYSVIILKAVNNQKYIDFYNNVKNNDTFKNWVATKKQSYFIEVLDSGSFVDGAGGEFRDFYNTSWREMPKWNDTTPQFIVYQACGTCSPSDIPVLTIHSTYVPGNDSVSTVISTLEKHLTVEA